MNVQRFTDQAAWLDALLADFLQALAGHDPKARFEVCLAGGSTPEPFYAALAAQPLTARMRLWPGDERLVPAAHPDRNGAMLARAFSACSWSPLPEMRTWPEGGDGAAIAAAFAAELAEALGQPAGAPPRFDLCYLGMGGDGHVAGLFPGDGALAASRAWAASARAPSPPRERVTLTLPVLTASARIRVLVRGPDKLAVLEALAAGDKQAQLLPIARIAGLDQTRIYWCP